MFNVGEEGLWPIDGASRSQPAAAAMHDRNVEIRLTRRPDMTDRVRFLTWNFNVFTRARDDLKVELIERLQPDVAALQEVSRTTANRIRDRLPEWQLFAGIEDSPWEGLGANGAAILTSPAVDVVKARAVEPEGWQHIGGDETAVPERQWTVHASVIVDGQRLEVVSAHPPNAAGSGEEHERRVVRKVRTYAALEHLVSGHDPLVIGMDANAWIDSEFPPYDPPVLADGPQRPIMDFLVTGTERHGLRDAYRDWLWRDPSRLAAVRARRPSGPLATTYVRGGNHPVPDRFDVVMVSPSLHVHDVEHGYEDSLACGSDHGYVLAELGLEERDGRDGFQS